MENARTAESNGGLVKSTRVETDYSRATGPGPYPSDIDIQAWLIAYLSNLLEMDPDDIKTNDALASYGLDSSASVGIVGDLAEWLEIKLEAELLYSYPTIESLARHLAAKGGR